MKTQEKSMSVAQQLRAEFKARGWNSRQISVRNDRGGLDSRLDIVIKCSGISYEAVSQIVSKYEKVDRCQSSGEILCGGNTFVSVTFDWEFMNRAIHGAIPRGREILNEGASFQSGTLMEVCKHHDATLFFVRYDGAQWGRIVAIDADNRNIGSKEVRTAECVANAITCFILYGRLYS